MDHLVIQLGCYSLAGYDSRTVRFALFFFFFFSFGEQHGIILPSQSVSQIKGMMLSIAFTKATSKTVNTAGCALLVADEATMWLGVL